MKKLMAFAVAVVVAFSAASVLAGEGCCAGMSKSSAKGGACGDMLSKLNLTPEQKTKVSALTEDCHKATSTSEFHAMFNAGLEKILTPEQLAQWKTQSDKAMKSTSGECPFMKSMGAKTDKQS